MNDQTPPRVQCLFTWRTKKQHVVSWLIWTVTQCEMLVYWEDIHMWRHYTTCGRAVYTCDVITPRVGEFRCVTSLHHVWESCLHIWRHYTTCGRVVYIHDGTTHVGELFTCVTSLHYVWEWFTCVTSPHDDGEQLQWRVILPNCFR